MGRRGEDAVNGSLVALRHGASAILVEIFRLGVAARGILVTSATTTGIRATWGPDAAE
jgi:hypothetical protein